MQSKNYIKSIFKQYQLNSVIILKSLFIFEETAQEKIQVVFSWKEIA